MNYLQSELSSLYPSFEAEQPSLCQTWSETPKISFLTMLLIWCKTLSFEQVNAKKHIRIVIIKMKNLFGEVYCTNFWLIRNSRKAFQSSINL